MKKLCLLLILCLFISSCNAKPKVEEDGTPVINIKEDTIFLSKDESFDNDSNVEVTFDSDGGNVEYSIEEREDCRIVTVKAIGNNGKESSSSFVIDYQITREKNAIVFGDSIVFGLFADNYSFVDHLKDDYDFNDVVKAGLPDFRVSTYPDANKWLGELVKRHYYDDYDYDYVILQGGVNDVLHDTPIGELSADKNYESFNTDTFMGGLEAYIYNVTTKWPNAKIGYIITYDTSSYTDGEKTWSKDVYKQYNDALKEVLNKWNVEYLDLSTDEFSELLKTDQPDNMDDGLHLNLYGHEIIAPYVYEWMKGLKRYS